MVPKFHWVKLSHPHSAYFSRVSSPRAIFSCHKTRKGSKVELLGRKKAPNLVPALKSLICIFPLHYLLHAYRGHYFVGQTVRLGLDVDFSWFSQIPCKPLPWGEKQKGSIQALIKESRISVCLLNWKYTDFLIENHWFYSYVCVLSGGYVGGEGFGRSQVFWDAN